ncbi:MAG: cytochrome c oxidase subunit II [Candidatus Marinimicrobia bacterium]|nr:cytochrome c oxidase subunit II [Candidatus Neomarinimicrobiota bacterium]MCF7829781.1 cytochrome c oxidase subunit II [Candidatus Neomarinimicrobiota bacterium]MCF7881786.1 cytochrome c oxidase subunit II [Candidatus Neomarinimicrobiota bacterium]
MDTTGTFWMPQGSSTIAGEVDALFYFILWASVFFFLLVVGLSIYFIMKYRRREGREEATSHIDYNIKLEAIWTIIPIILVVIVFVWGFKTYMKMQIVPRDAIEIKVTGRQWMWLFDYPNGSNSINELVVPVDQPVKLTLSSEDVIHSFYIPQFRIKQDVLPSRYTIAWFEATNTGEYDLYCAEFCGKGHSEMLATVRVVSQEQYASFLEGAGVEGGEGMSLEQVGKQVYTSRACNTCHSIDGSPNVGPTFQNAYGHEVQLQDGSTVTVDENYIRESILEPKAKVVEGFQPVMPTFQGLVSERQIDGIIAYLKSLSEVEDMSEASEEEQTE